jgi:carbon-monoxide dehydrogenase large subunit
VRYLERSPRNRAKPAFQVSFNARSYVSVALENAIALQKFGVGQPVRRKEDDTLVRGKGKYTDDFSLPGQAYAWIVRSSHAHGVIRGIDTQAAKAMPGVLGVWTGTDLVAAGYGPYTCGLPLKSRDGTPLLQTNRTALMTDKVRYVGDPVAFVVAETLAQARDAGERSRSISIPCRRTSAEKRQSRRAAALRSHPQQCGAGLSLRRPAKVEAAFAAAAHVTKLDIVNTRVAWWRWSRARRWLLRQIDRALHHPGSDPGRRRQPDETCKKPAERAERQGSLLTAKCRRLLGMKNINYPEYICILHAGKVLGPSGEMDRRTLDQFSVRQPRPRRSRSIASLRSMPTASFWR